MLTGGGLIILSISILIIGVTSSADQGDSETKASKSTQELHVGPHGEDSPIIQLTEPEQSVILQMLEDSRRMGGTLNDLMNSKQPPRVHLHEPRGAGSDYIEMGPGFSSKQKRDGRFGPNIGPFITGRMNDGGPFRYAPAFIEKDAILAKAGAWKRKGGGKLCYINPIACFGRRQREAAA